MCMSVTLVGWSVTLKDCLGMGSSRAHKSEQLEWRRWDCTSVPGVLAYSRPFLCALGVLLLSLSSIVSTGQVWWLYCLHICQALSSVPVPKGPLLLWQLCKWTSLSCPQNVQEKIEIYMTAACTNESDSPIHRMCEKIKSQQLCKQPHLSYIHRMCMRENTLIIVLSLTSMKHLCITVI